MMKLIKLHEIRTLPVGSAQWELSVKKFALMSLTHDEEHDLKSKGLIIKQLHIGSCNDRKMYKCLVKLVILGSTENTELTYEEIPPV